MTFQEIGSRFQGVAQNLGLRFAKAPFREGDSPETPYLAFSTPSRPDFPADNEGYVKISRIIILLVTSEEEAALEEAVERELEALGIQFKKESDYYSDEDVFIASFETEELIDA